MSQENSAWKVVKRKRKKKKQRVVSDPSSSEEHNDEKSKQRGKNSENPQNNPDQSKETKKKGNKGKQRNGEEGKSVKNPNKKEGKKENLNEKEVKGEKQGKKTQPEKNDSKVAGKSPKKAVKTSPKKGIVKSPEKTKKNIKKPKIVKKKKEISKTFLYRLPLRVCLGIIRFLNSFNTFQINVDEEGRYYRSKKIIEKKTSKKNKEKKEIDYFSQKDIINKIYGVFKKDRSRRIFFIYNGMEFNGKKIKNEKLCPKDEFKFLIPKNARNLTIKNFKLKNDAFIFNDYPFLKSLSIEGCIFDNAFTVLKKFSSKNLRKAVIKEVENTNENTEEENFEKIFSSLKNCKKLHVEKCELFSKILKSLISNPRTKIKDLAIVNFQNVDDLFENFEAKIPKLRINNCKFTEKLLRIIEKNESIKFLEIISSRQDTKYFSFKEYLGLFKMKNIVELSLNHIDFNRIYYKELEQFTSKLKKLHLTRNYSSGLNEHFFRYIGKVCEDLEALNLYDSEIDDLCAKSLPIFKKLKSLNLDYNYVTKKGIKHITRLWNLETLNINGCKGFGDDELKFILSKLRKLSYLSVAFTTITNQGVEHFKRSKVRGVNVERTKVTKKGITKIKRNETIKSCSFKYGADGSNLRWDRDRMNVYKIGEEEYDDYEKPSFFFC